MVAVEDLGSSGVCEVQSCVQTSCTFLWSGWTLVPLSLPFFSTLACVLGGIRSQASVKGPSPWFMLWFILSFRLLWPSLCLPLSCVVRTVSFCSLFQWILLELIMLNWSKCVIFCGCMKIYREKWNWVFPSVGVLTFVFCHCDKCIIALYFNYTKALFVLFKSQFLKLLFNYIVQWCIEFSISDVSVIISVGYCLSIGCWTTVLWIIQVSQSAFVKHFSVYSTLLMKSMAPCETVGQYLLSSVWCTPGALALNSTKRTTAMDGNSVREVHKMSVYTCQKHLLVYFSLNTLEAVGNTHSHNSRPNGCEWRRHWSVYSKELLSNCYWN